jgi:hypothetical protein
VLIADDSAVSRKLVGKQLREALARRGLHATAATGDAGCNYLIQVIEARLNLTALEVIMNASIESVNANAVAGATALEEGPGECVLVILGTSGVDDRVTCAAASALSNLTGCKAEFVLMSASNDASLLYGAPSRIANTAVVAVADGAAIVMRAEMSAGSSDACWGGADAWDQGNSFDACMQPWDTSVGDLILTAFRDVLFKPVTKPDVEELIDTWIAKRCSGYGGCGGVNEGERTPPADRHGASYSALGLPADDSGGASRNCYGNQGLLVGLDFSGFAAGGVSDGASRSESGGASCNREWAGEIAVVVVDAAATLTSSDKRPGGTWIPCSNQDRRQETAVINNSSQQL